MTSITIHKSLASNPFKKPWLCGEVLKMAQKFSKMQKISQNHINLHLKIKRNSVNSRSLVVSSEKTKPNWKEKHRVAIYATGKAHRHIALQQQLCASGPLCLYSRNCLGLIMQNKANFRKGNLYVRYYLKTIYEDIPLVRLQKTKPICAITAPRTQKSPLLGER